MPETRILPSLASQFAVACSLATLYHILAISEAPPEWFFPQVLLLYAPLIYGLDRLFLRRVRTLRALCMLNGAAGILLLAACLYFETWKGWAVFLFWVICAGWLTIKGGQLALSGPSLRGMLLCLDGSMVLLICIAAYTALTGAELMVSLPAAGGFAAAVLGVISCRSGRPLTGKAWLATITAFAVLFLGLWLLLGAAAVPAGQALAALWALLLAALKAVGSALLRFFTALFARLPGQDAGELLISESAGSHSAQGPAVESIPAAVPALLAALLAVLLAALLLWVLYRLGRVRLGGLGGKAVTAAGRRSRPSLRRALGGLFASWAAYLRLRLSLWKHRSTPKGLYFLLVYRCRRGPWRKQPGETPREFLHRLARCAQGDQALAAAVLRLAREVDISFYSGHPGPARAEEAGLIRRRLGRAMRWQLLRRTLSRLKRRPRQKAPVGPG